MTANPELAGLSQTLDVQIDELRRIQARRQ